MSENQGIEGEDEHKLTILVLGAHPDDAEYYAGPLLVAYRALGHRVKMVSVTDGSAGHFRLSGAELAAIRQQEAAASAALIGATSGVWANPDGRLEPSLQVRDQIIREIRATNPDLVMTHRPNDYHPDHRAVGQAVQDASYLVTVPPVIPEVPFLARDPVVAYLPDRFTKPTPMSADVIIDVSKHMQQAIAMLACHKSQFFEWLPFNRHALEEVPKDDAQRLVWLGDQYREFIRGHAERFRQELIAAYGPPGATISYAIPLEISEYAGDFGLDQRRRLFPFSPE